MESSPFEGSYHEFYASFTKRLIILSPPPSVDTPKNFPIPFKDNQNVALGELLNLYIRPTIREIKCQHCKSTK